MELNITLKKLSYTAVFFLISTLGLWARASYEEKYYIILDNRDTFFNRSLEKEFIDYSRSKQKDIVLYSVEALKESEKRDVLLRGASNQYPVLISSGFDPDRTIVLENAFFKEGAASIDGYMGSFIFFNEPEGLKTNYALRLPWHEFTINTSYMAKEILKSLGQDITELDTSKITDQGNQNVSSNKTTSNTLLVVIKNYTQKDHSMYKSVYDYLNSYNTDPSLSIVPIYLNQNLNNVDEDENQNLNSTPSSTTTESPSPDKSFLKSNRGAKGSEFYRLLESYTAGGKQIPTQTVAIVCPSDNEAFLFHEFFKDNNISSNEIKLIGFGNSPEARKNMEEGGNFILSFEIDTKDYVNKIMEAAYVLYTRVLSYPLNFEKLEGKELYQTFVDTPESIEVKAIHQ